MFQPKEQLQRTLKELGYPVQQSSQKAVIGSPAITFRIDDNTPRYNLNNEIVAQDILATVDLWADDSPTTSRMLGEVEAKMRSIGYQLTYSADVPSPAGTLFHTVARFELLATEDIS